MAGAAPDFNLLRVYRTVGARCAFYLDRGSDCYPAVLLFDPGCAGDVNGVAAHSPVAYEAGSAWQAFNDACEFGFVFMISVCGGYNTEAQYQWYQRHESYYTAFHLTLPDVLPDIL
jgi:hypothetical protein